MFFFFNFQTTVLSITSSLELSYEDSVDLEELEKDPLHLLQNTEFQIDSPVQRIKRGTTIVHHRVRKRRPKPIRKVRRPPKKRPPKPRPVYGPPPTTQIHIHPPSAPSFTGPSGPEIKNNNQYSNHFAEPPGPSAFSSPPQNSFVPSSNSIYKKEVTQYQSQQLPLPQPPRQQITQISQQFGIPAQQPPQQSNFYPQDPPVFQNPPNTFSHSIPVGPPSSPPIPTHTYNQNSLSPNTITQLVPVNNYQSNSKRVPISTIGEIPTQSIPLDTSFQGDPYRNTVSSYDVPIGSFNIRPNNPSQSNKISATQTTSINYVPAQSSINFSPPRGLPTTQYEIQNTDFSTTNNNQPPVLPTRYEPSDFSAIQAKIPDNRFNNAKTTDLFDDSSLEKFLNDVSESKRISVKTRPEKKRSKPKTTPKPKSKSRPQNSGENTSSSFFDEDDDDFSFENFPYNIPTTASTTTTTKRPKHRRRKRPKVSSTTQHILDVDDLKDTFESGSEVQEYIIAADDSSNFEPKKYYKVSKTPIQLTKNNFIPISKAPTTKPTSTTNYIFVSSPNDFRDDTPKYYTRSKTEKPPRIKLPAFTYRPKRVRPTPQQTVYHDVTEDNSGEVKILSIQKSKSHSFYAGSEKEKPNTNNFDVGFTFPNDENFPEDLNHFTSGVYLTNGGFGTRIKHGRAKKDMDSEEDYLFEAEYEIELPSNHRFYKK